MLAGSGAVIPLPEHTVVVHPRARRVRLRVTPERGLVVTVPPRVPAREVERVVREHAEWARRQLEHVRERRELLALGAEALLPDEVRFAATGERWEVHYVHGPGAVRVTARPGTLTVAGRVADADACLAALRRWLQRAAAERLLPLLDSVAAEQGLVYARASVRGQRTRWGSCSRAGSISLNRALMFVPPGLVRGIVLHELVHTLHHDHSTRFWTELERRDPLSRAARKALRDAWEELPPWAVPS